MARGAAQARRKGAKSQPGTRKQTAARRPPTIEQTMFFPRLRRQAKWVFLLLAVIFAGGFVFFGVGSGSTGLGDLLRGNFNIFGSNSGSTNSSAVKSALKETEAQNLQAQAPLSLAGVLGVSSTSPIGQALSNDPTSQQLTQKAQAAFTEANTALQKDTGLYKRIAKLQPNDVNTQFHYAQLADITGDTTAAIKAYKQVVKLAPTDPSAQQAKQRIAVLSLA